MRRSLIFAFASVIVLLFAPLAFAPDGSIPHLINYQGMLTNDLGEPLDGNFNLTFRIFDDPDAGSQKWGETQNNIPVENGLFSVILGSADPIDLPFDQDYWLEIEVGILGPLSPRARLTSVGYAYRAEWADTSNYSFRAKMADTADYATVAVAAESDSDWTIAGNNMYSAVSGNVGIGTSSPTSPLTIQPVLGPDLEFTGGSWNADIMANRQFNVGTSNASTFSILTDQHYRLLIQGGGNVGIGTMSPAAKLEVFYDNTDHNSAAISIDNGTGAPRQDVLDFKFGGVTEARIRKATNGELFIGTVDNKSIRFRTNATNRMAIANTGEVGIGTITPAYNLEIVGSEDVFRAGNSTAWVEMRTMGNSAISFGDGDDGERAGFVTGDENTGGENVLKIAACDDAHNCPKYTYFHESGNVGIGTSSPQRPLHISDVLRLEPRASAPTSPSEGDIYVNSGDHHIYCYLNGVWRQLDPSP